MSERFDRIWHNARLATMRADRSDLDEIEHRVIATRGGHIVYARAAADFPGGAGYLADVAPRLMAAAREAGVLLRPLGNTVYVMPPYCIDEAALDQVYGLISAF